MPYLILIKHSHSQVDPNRPASQWGLSEVGLRRCFPLAEKLGAYAPDSIISSEEPKAIKTGQIVAEVLQKPFKTAPNLHEHDRENAPFFATVDGFREAVATFFAHPQELVFGGETAEQAYQRFARAVDTVIADYPDQTIALVAHGTVITLLVSRKLGLDPYPFWERLDLPSFVVLTLPTFEMVTLVETVENKETFLISKF